MLPYGQIFVETKLRYVVSPVQGKFKYVEILRHETLGQSSGVEYNLIHVNLFIWKIALTSLIELIKCGLCHFKV